MAQHIPMACRDHSDAWIECTCGWGSFGTNGDDWLEHTQIALNADIERLKAPITTAEIEAVWEARKPLRNQGLCDYEAIGPVAMAIISARFS